MSWGKATTNNLVYSGLIGKKLVEYHLLIEIKSLFTSEMMLAESDTLNLKNS